MAQRPRPRLALFSRPIRPLSSPHARTTPLGSTQLPARATTKRSEHTLSRPASRSSRHNIYKTPTSFQHKSTSKTTTNDIDAYYDSLTPLSSTSATSSTPISHISPLSSTTRSPPKTTAEKAAVIFGSRLAGPAARRRELDLSSRRIEGILVPPKPAEPDNCCMSGCVNCVWDTYREELESWSERSREVGRRRAERFKVEGGDGGSVEGDGGGLGAWGGNGGGRGMGSGQSGDGEVEDLMADVPVGIREFVRQEKRLRERRESRAREVA